MSEHPEQNTQLGPPSKKCPDHLTVFTDVCPVCEQELMKLQILTPEEKAALKAVPLPVYKLLHDGRGMVGANPDEYGAQWYRREDVDRRIAELERFKAGALKLTTEASVEQVLK